MKETSDGGEPYPPHRAVRPWAFTVIAGMRAKRWDLNRTTLLAFAFLFSSIASPLFARMMAIDTARPAFSELSKITALPNLEQCTHKTGRLWLTVSNWGILGNQRNVFFRDCLTGGFSSSAEFPGGSGVEYLFQGALWVGGIVGKENDTLVSVGSDGWVGIRELYPEAGAYGSILKRSARPTSPYYNPAAVSDLDIISVFYDTLKDPRLVTSPDPETGDLFHPLGLKIEQRSYSWAADFGKDWVLLDYTLTNLGPEPIRQAYFGILLDPDIGSVDANRLTHTDDYSAFRPGAFLKVADPAANGPGIDPYFLICRETLNLAYAYDNDGDPQENGGYGVRSPTGGIGLRVLRAGELLGVHGTLPDPNIHIAFNWWVPDSNGVLDWGPQHLPGRQNSFAHYGQPMGDRMKYFYLSNREQDYDQIFSAKNQNRPFEEIWRPPLVPQDAAIDLAGGADSRFLLSVGPFDLEVGESVPLTFVLLAGDKFHDDPANYAFNFQNPSTDFLDSVRILAYQNRLNLGALIANARMAKNVFDNENVLATVICQFESQFPTYDIRFIGDGIPDFKGPTPPPFPKVEFSTAEGEVTIRWFGRETENAIDPFTGLKDFEGYSVQMSTDGFNYAVVGYFDKVNWRVHYLNPDVNGNGYTDPDDPYNNFDDTLDTRWEPARQRPLTYEEIQNFYALRWDTCVNKPGNIVKPIDPQKYNAPIFVIRVTRYSYRDLPLVPPYNPWCKPDTNKTAVRVRFCDSCGRSPSGLPARVDTVFYFIPEGYNTGLEKARMFPAVTDPENDSAYWYQMKLTGLFPSQPLFLAVVPFDNGMLTYYQHIESQSPPTSAIARLIYPVATDSARKAGELKISVYPNPYRIDEDYSHFEKNQPASGHPQSSKKINFINLPPKCTIRIYTLDGDLVQQVNHDKDPAASDSGYEFWDLLTRNAQLVVAGLYLYVVESSEGRNVGKIVIIR
ncbi:MAG: hypothetical protein L0196_01565 [candidate division Zixibacteria bacterium]|nr:hypothetical protein [candidate division Zixibacteria bacterium]